MKCWTVMAMCIFGVSAAAWGQDAAVRIGEVSARQAALSKVIPDYPLAAKQMRLAGRVEVEVFIDTDGNVEKARVLNGNPLLSSAAVAALKKWKFTPFSTEGKATRVVTTISFDFKL
jgi:protein TonB